MKDEKVNNKLHNTFTIFISVFLFLISYFLFPISIFAHQLKTDENIGAVLHVSPEDDPIAGEPAGFFFEFKDKTGKFDPENCDCIATIYLEDKEVFKTDLTTDETEPSLTSSSFFYTFPNKGVYILIINGNPIFEDAHQPFELKYSIRVEKVSESPKENVDSKNTIVNTNSELHWWHYILGLLSFIFTLSILWISFKKK